MTDDPSIHGFGHQAIIMESRRIISLDELRCGGCDVPQDWQLTLLIVRCCSGGKYGSFRGLFSECLRHLGYMSELFQSNRMISQANNSSDRRLCSGVFKGASRERQCDVVATGVRASRSRAQIAGFVEQVQGAK